MSEDNFFVNKFLYFQEKNQNDYFYNSLIYIFEHNQQGALGIVMNKVIPISESTIFKSLKINAEVDKKNLLNGGPVDMNKLFVIHNQPSQKESLIVPNGLSLTSSIDVIESIGNGTFGNSYRLALGYCGWDAGQLDYEVSKNIPGFLLCLMLTLQLRLRQKQMFVVHLLMRLKLLNHWV